MLSNAIRISTSLHDFAAELADCRVDQSTPNSAKAAAQCAGIIQAVEPTIVGHISTSDSDEPAATRGLAGEVRAEPTRAH